MSSPVPRLQQKQLATLAPIAALLIGWRVFTLMCAWFATFLLPLQTTFTPFLTSFRANLPYYIWIWGNFDGIHYMSIAEKGYSPFRQPFFPLYPILVRILHQLTSLPYLLAALVTSHLMFLAAIWVIWKLFHIDGVRRSSRWLFLTILITFPTAFTFGSAYNDALFLLLACVTVLFTRQQRWGWASLVGGLATLTRLNGLALAVFIVAEYFTTTKLKTPSKHDVKGTTSGILSEVTALALAHTWDVSTFRKNLQHRIHWQTIWKTRIWLVLLIPIAFLTYLTYIQITFHSWQVLFTSMSIWNQDHIVFPLQVVWRYLKILRFHQPTYITYWVAVIELGFVAFYSLVVLLAIRKIRFSYWIFIVAMLLMPMLTGTFAGMPRYALHLYPFFLALTVLLEDRPAWLRIEYLVTSSIMMAIIISFFTRGYFIT